jgi:tRNA dimethylallyltransferase
MTAAENITEQGKTPLFVGGTGLYIDTVIRGGAQISPPSSAEYREQLLAGCDSEEGIDALWQRLYEVDPCSAEKIHKNNVRRVARALEIYELSGKTKTYFDEQSRAVAPDISVLMLTLDFHNRDLLYERVDKRVDLMIAEGLLDEVRALYERGVLNGDNTASAAIGYKELLSYIKGDTSLDEAVELLKQSSRRYAKRQLTWFRHEQDAIRIFADCEDGTLKSLDALCTDAINKIKESGFLNDN